MPQKQSQDFSEEAWYRTAPSAVILLRQLARARTYFALCESQYGGPARQPRNTEIKTLTRLASIFASALAIFANPAPSVPALGYTSPSGLVDFAEYSSVAYRLVHIQGSFHQVYVSQVPVWQAATASVLTFVGPDGAVVLESIAPGGAYLNHGHWTMLLKNRRTFGRFSNQAVRFVEASPRCATNILVFSQPCPDGAPSDVYGSSASASPMPSDCWQSVAIQEVGGSIIGYTWTCTKPGGSQPCEVSITEPGVGASGTYTGDCGGGNFQYTTYNQGRIFACKD